MEEPRILTIVYTYALGDYYIDSIVAFDNDEAALKCYNYHVKKKHDVGIQEVHLYSTFEEKE